MCLYIWNRALQRKPGKKELTRQENNILNWLCTTFRAVVGKLRLTLGGLCDGMNGFMVTTSKPIPCRTGPTVRYRIFPAVVHSPSYKQVQLVFTSTDWDRRMVTGAGRVGCKKRENKQINCKVRSVSIKVYEHITLHIEETSKEVPWTQRGWRWTTRTGGQTDTVWSNRAWTSSPFRR